MSGTVHLRAVTVESVQVPIESTVDPTSGTIAFALSAPGAATPGTYAPGAWSGGWSSGRATAVTPTIGETGTLEVEAGNYYDVWCKVTGVGGEVPQWVVGRLVVS